MNKDSVTTLQKGSRRNVSPVHVHLTDATPFHVHLKKPIKPIPVYPKTVIKSKSNPRSVTNLNNSNNPRDFSARFGNHKGTPEEFDFGRSYGSESDEKPDGMEFPASQKLLREKESILEEYRRKLSESEKENKKLVQDMEEICLGLEGRSDLSFMDLDLNRLTNSQHFLQAMAIKMDDFGTMLRHLREDRIACISNADLDAILTQKKILERDLVTFDDVCIFLRREMRRTIEGRSKVREMLREREEIMTRLENFRESYEALKKNLVDTENRAKEAFSELENNRMGQTQSNTIIETLRMTKAHLQRELSAREAECNKLSVKMKDLQEKLDREKQAREKIDQDKESLKKATRLHKTKASQKAESLEQVNKLLTSKEAEVSDLTQKLTSLRLQLSQVATEKLAMAAELNEAKLKLIPPSKSAIKQRMRKLPSDEEVTDNDEVISGDDDVQSNQLKKTKKTLKGRERIEKDNAMKTSLMEAETKVSHIQSETSQLRMKVQEFENIIEEYKDQVTLSRQEADMYRSQVEDLRKELTRSKFERDFESNRARHPETTGEVDLGRILNENNSSNVFGSGKILSDRIELLDKRILSLEDDNKELAVLNGKREEALHQTNLRLEEKISENSTLQRQFDTLMADVRRMKDSEKDRIAAAERSNQVHILELEGQINQLKHDIEKLKREKDEIERRLHQKMYDLQDELKQSHSTNRALQNFIHFLKSSYNATFDQPSLATFSSIPNLASLGR